MLDQLLVAFVAGLHSGVVADKPLFLGRGRAVAFVAQRNPVGRDFDAEGPVLGVEPVGVELGAVCALLRPYERRCQC